MAFFVGHDFTLSYVAEVFRNPVYVEGLRNALLIAIGSTLAAFALAMPLAWRELTPKLDPASYTVLTVPKLLARRKDPWAEAAGWEQRLPDLTAPPASKPAGAARIVTARKPRKQ